MKEIKSLKNVDDVLEERSALVAASDRYRYVNKVKPIPGVSESYCEGYKDSIGESLLGSDGKKLLELKLTDRHFDVKAIEFTHEPSILR
ncbi:hypothetical protein Tco_1015816 [Tanacetum coccineum]|uniref:Uncharacterized protein n=1 Tax=Tanacetum coccineum TaxID=301880 RepID=A0ABQ5FLZ9_9ASTR